MRITTNFKVQTKEYADTSGNILNNSNKLNYMCENI